MVFYEIFICGRWRFIEPIFPVLSFHDLWHSVYVSPIQIVGIIESWSGPDQIINEEQTWFCCCWSWAGELAECLLRISVQTMRGRERAGWLLDPRLLGLICVPLWCWRALGRAGRQGSWEREESVPPPPATITTTTAAQHWAGTRLYAHLTDWLSD